MSDLHVVVLAAGKGTRMKSEVPKVLHPVAGVPMIDLVLDEAATLAPASVTVVLGHQAKAVREHLLQRPGLTFVVQEPQLGTAHAVMTTEPALTNASGTLVLLSGDVPLLSARTLRDLVDCHQRTGAALTVVTAVVDDPHGYGRIVRSGGRIARIVEEKDATTGEREIREINSGIYAFDLEGFFEALRKIGTENVQREYYLPDLVGIYRHRGRGVETMTVTNASEVQGINSRSELAAVSRRLREAKNDELMAAGVTLQDPSTTYIDRDVQVGADTVIHPGVTLEGGTTIGARCVIYGGVRITDSTIGDGVTVYDHCVITSSIVQADGRVGPFAHLRGGVTIGERAKVGNFVEMKKTALGDGSKAMHLSYLGDAQIGTDVNIGAGTITCNYDGVKKHTTTIEDGAFIGSDSQLVAPVVVGKGAYVGTGTTVRENVPPGSLAVSAGKQRNIEDWVEKKKRQRQS